VPRTLQPGQRCEVWVGSALTGSRELIYSTDSLLLEAPNWTPDGSALILNGAGTLWRLQLAGLSLAAIRVTGVPALNNDHVIAPGGDRLYLSAEDGHLYRAGIDGGDAERVTAADGFAHYLHGISPDGDRLAAVAIEAGDFSRPGRLVTMPADGGPVTAVDTGPGHCDGPEYSPDGAWIYLNTEAFTDRPGHAQLARVRPDGSRLECLLRSASVDWFPHLSPDGRFASYLRFPAGTLGHPENLDVEVVVVALEDWTTPLYSWAVFGGQGTLNVNSWAPDSDHFAFVTYPFD